MRQLWFVPFGSMVLAAGLLSAMPASTAEKAAVYPWCAQYGGDNDGNNCGFVSYEQCQWALSGNGGFCVRNPFHPDWDPTKRSKSRPTRG